MAQKPNIPKGTRDFSPQEMRQRNYIFDTIRSVFSLHGFLPIETPAMENLSTLMGKYGEEGDKLLFKILNSGDFLEQVDLQQGEYKKITTQISEKGLRYDLTVPFARYVVQHQNEICFPFKRYQIQAVWRADRPQKGRYREFFQCDVDVIGSNSLLNEVELVSMIDEVFKALDIRVQVKLNNRKILYGIAQSIACEKNMIDITVAIDKLDKIGLDKVNEELLSKGLPQKAVEALQPILLLEGSFEDKIAQLSIFLASSPEGLKGIEEIKEMFANLAILPLSCAYELDLTLARGLNYYTGAIFEVKALDAQMGSICGGGRYDDLTGIFGLKGVSGVGVSFGADRIFDVLNELNKFPLDIFSGSQVLFVNFGKAEQSYCLPIVNAIRKKGIAAELYPDAAKLQKQLSYANAHKIPFVVLVGEEELKTEKFMLKDMNQGEQTLVSAEELIEKLQK
ncbi:MAG: histidine--tRNA ligase [Bacteroidales bacterium]